MRLKELAKKCDYAKAALNLLKMALKNGDEGKVRDYKGQLLGMAMVLEELGLITFREVMELSEELTDMI